MPNVNLSTLSGPELRRLLDSARQRGEAALSYRILQEMEARREKGERKGLFPTRRSSEPHTVEVDLGDPMDRDDDDVPPMPYWRAPSQVSEVEASAELEPEPPPETPPPSLRRVKTPPEAASPTEEEPAAPEPEPPLTFHVPEPEHVAEGPAEEWDLRLHPPAVQSRPPPPRRGLRRGLVVGFAVGIAAGVALGWWVWGTAQQVPAPAAAPAAPIQTAAVAAPPPQVPPPAAVTPEPAPAAPPTPDIEPSPPESVEASEAVENPTPAPPAPREADACAAQPTPADRTICGDQQLRELQRQLRQAYNEALEAHEDRALLRQRQLAWASARDTVTDPDRLLELYEQRIHKLNAATAAARQEH